MSTIVHDTTEALCLCQDHSLYLKPIAKMTVSVALPQLKTPGKSISNWEVMERVKAMVAPEQFSALRISKSTMDFIRFEGEVENKGVVKLLRERLDGKSIKLSGFTDILKVRAVENKVDFPTKYDWDSFFRDAEDMNESVPGERPDTIHLEGLPCRWFSQKDSPHPDRPSEETLAKVFQSFGKVRNVDIPMLDPYREEMLDKNFNTFSFGGHLNFEAYVQYQEYQGFIKAMDTLRGMKLMLKGEDGKAVACNIKVAFDTSKHLSEVAVKRRQQERLKLQELERQREEQKRREKEEEERRKEEERKQKEQEEEEKERRREERLRKKEQKQREREERRNLKKVKRQQEEEQRKLQMKIATEERRLLLAQRNLESIRLIAELLARAKALKQQQQEKERAEREERERQELARQQDELARLERLEACRRRQEEELRRVEAEKERTLDLQRKERDLREKLLGNLLKKGSGGGGGADEDDNVEALHREEASSVGLVGSDVLLGLILAPVVNNRAKASEGGDKDGPVGRQPSVKSGVHSQVAERKKKVSSSSSAARRERRGGGGGEDRKRRDREPYKEERRDVRERSSRERARERRSCSQERRRRTERRDSRSRRRSHSRHSSSRRRGGSRRRSHSRHRRRRSSRSTSSSRDRSRSSGGRSHRRSSSRRRTRSSSRSTSRSRDRRSRSRGGERRSRRHSRSYSRDRRRR